MKKITVGIIILLITALCIAVAVISTPKEEKAADTENSQENINSEEAYLEFKKYITSSKELIQDTDYYINQARNDITGTFDILNQQTDELLDIIFDNKTTDISEKLNFIKKGDAELSAKIDAAINKFVTNDYKSAFAALKKYISLQNQMIYKIADIYEKEKSVSYEIYTGMLHTTHQDMNQQEIDYINFLSGVDYYADKEK